MPRNEPRPQLPFAFSNNDLDQDSRALPEPLEKKSWWQSFTKPPKGTYGADYPIVTW